jgi:hypothetical protein
MTSAEPLATQVQYTTMFSRGKSDILRCRALYLETVFDYCRNEGVARIPSGQSFARC